jgi:hypothetical protein
MFFHQYTLRIIDARMMQIRQKRHSLCYLLPNTIAFAATDARYKEEDFSVTNQLVKQVISLLMHT